MANTYYSIWACFDGSWEKIDSTNRGEDYAWYLAREYRMAYGKNTPMEVRHKGERTQI